jgi:xylulokinase
MWVEALDRLLERMRQDRGVRSGRIAAVSGSGQQHGSVYWRSGCPDLDSKALDSRSPLLDRSFSALFLPLTDSPIWMDSSTGSECRAREQALGGPQAVADLTGSRAYERFTGNQIARIVPPASPGLRGHRTDRPGQFFHGQLS